MKKYDKGEVIALAVWASAHQLLVWLNLTSQENRREGQLKYLYYIYKRSDKREKIYFSYGLHMKTNLLSFSMTKNNRPCSAVVWREKYQPLNKINDQQTEKTIPTQAYKE